MWLVEQGHCNSREQAQQAIRAGWILINGAVWDKPSLEVKPPVEVVIRQQAPFVSRGGEKLRGAIEEFMIPVQGRICLDGGISTGGFTDYLLKQGAQKIYGVDVGYGQVAWAIRCHPQVVLKERTNLRHLAPAELYPEAEPWADFGVVDLSFISLTKVLPALWHLLKEPRELLLLVKPQFEADRSEIGKHGLVKDAKVHTAVIEKVSQASIELGWQKLGQMPAPIKGRTGNQEYWLWLKQSD